MVYKFDMNKFTRILPIIIFVNLFNLQVFAVNLSVNSKISLLTCSAGEELYTSFGHSAIHVRDDSLGVNVVFNYGTFDFNTPNFYLKFANGELDYMLATNDFERFCYVYKRENRSVVEHELNLTQREKQELWDKLLINYQPQNRYYRYDFFFDNCATRIRDLVFDVKGISAEDYQTPTGKTFRDYIHENIGNTCFASQGIDLLLGTKTDEFTVVYNRAYLPVYLDSLFVNSNLFVNSQTIVNYEYESLNTTDYYWLLVAIPLILITILISILEVYYCKSYKIFDIILFSIVSLFAVLFWYTLICTCHKVMWFNFNVLWASIFYLPMIVAVIKNIKLFTVTCALINCAMLVAFILLSAFGVQDFPYISYVVAFCLAIRNVLIIRQLK